MWSAVATALFAAQTNMAPIDADALIVEVAHYGLALGGGTNILIVNLGLTVAVAVCRPSALARWTRANGLYCWVVGSDLCGVG